MPQEFQVLQCYSCQFFQVHIVKKTTKWQCKMCGEKQSMLKVIAVGSGKECRLIVQDLNANRPKGEHNGTTNTSYGAADFNQQQSFARGFVCDYKKTNNTKDFYNPAETGKDSAPFESHFNRTLSDEGHSRNILSVRTQNALKTSIFDEDFDVNDLDL